MKIVLEFLDDVYGMAFNDALCVKLNAVGGCAGR